MSKNFEKKVRKWKISLPQGKIEMTEQIEEPEDVSAGFVFVFAFVLVGGTTVKAVYTEKE